MVLHSIDVGFKGASQLELIRELRNKIRYLTFKCLITGVITVNFLIQNTCQQKENCVSQSCTVQMKRIIKKVGLELLALKSATVHFVSLLGTLSLANIIQLDTEHVTTSMYKQI